MIGLVWFLSGWGFLCVCFPFFLLFCAVLCVCVCVAVIVLINRMKGISEENWHGCANPVSLYQRPHSLWL